MAVPGWREPLSRLTRALERALARGLRGTVGGSSGAGPWVALGVAFVVVTLLGTIGFTRHQEAIGAVEPIASRIYAAVQLFVLEGGAVAGPIPWELQLARYAAPLVAAYAIIRGLALLFRDEVEALRLRSVTGQVIVAGLGRKGTLLANALLAAGRRVVVVESNRENPELDAVRARGALAVIGDARRAETLRRARLGRATHLVALCGADVTNAEIYASAREAATARRSGVLQCVVHLVDPDLCLLLRGEELERYGRAPIRADFVNTYAAGAEALVRLHPPQPEEDGGAPRLAVVGAGPTARHLLVALARAWAAVDPEPVARLPVQVVGWDRSALRELVDRHVELARFVAAELGEDLAAVTPRPPRTIYVCPDDDADAASAALQLRTSLVGQPVRIVVVLEERSGIGHLLADAPEPPGGPVLTTFGVLDEVCQPEVLLTGTTELLAQALHRAYVGSQRERSGDPSALPWPELPEPLRESNRDQAAHIAVKLAAVGDTIGPLVDWEEARRPFAPDEVDTMARLEHERWAAERRRVGWRPGPRDPLRHTTPYLVPWDELTETIREQDRVFVRGLPDVLASVGLQVRHRDTNRRSPDGGTAEEAARAPAARSGR